MRGVIGRKKLRTMRTAALGEDDDRDPFLSAAAHYKQGDTLDPAPVYLPPADPHVMLKRSELDALLARISALESPEKAPAA